MIFVMMEDVVIPSDSVHVPPFLKEAMRKSPCINFSDDSFFDSKCEELFRSIAHSLSLSFLGSDFSCSDNAMSTSADLVSTMRNIPVPLAR
jgi:hypothetical protein